MMEAISSSVSSVLTKATRCNISRTLPLDRHDHQGTVRSTTRPEGSPTLQTLKDDAEVGEREDSSGKRHTTKPNRQGKDLLPNGHWWDVFTRLVANYSHRGRRIQCYDTRHNAQWQIFVLVVPFSFIFSTSKTCCELQINTRLMLPSEISISSLLSSVASYI
jgi:hypothetical protein